MIKGIAKCSLCGKTFPRDELIAYNFPNGTRLVCKRCYKTLPPDPIKSIRRPDGKKKKPEDDLYPPF